MGMEMSLYGVPISDRWSPAELLWYNWRYDELSAEEQWELRHFLLPNQWECFRSHCITPLFGEWRKAYHIDYWFDAHVKCGFDAHTDFRVSIEQLLDLRSVCVKVMSNRQVASKLMWTSEIYGEYYFQQTEEGIRYIDQAVAFLQENPDYCCVYVLS